MRHANCDNETPEYIVLINFATLIVFMHCLLITKEIIIKIN